MQILRFQPGTGTPILLATMPMKEITQKLPKKTRKIIPQAIRCQETMAVLRTIQIKAARTKKTTNRREMPFRHRIINENRQIHTTTQVRRLIRRRVTTTIKTTQRQNRPIQTREPDQIPTQVPILRVPIQENEEIKKAPIF